MVFKFDMRVFRIILHNMAYSGLVGLLCCSYNICSAFYWQHCSKMAVNNDHLDFSMYHCMK